MASGSIVSVPSLRRRHVVSRRKSPSARLENGGVSRNPTRTSETCCSSYGLLATTRQRAPVGIGGERDGLVDVFQYVATVCEAMQKLEMALQKHKVRPVGDRVWVR